jgi:hypothetical protein
MRSHLLLLLAALLAFAQSPVLAAEKERVTEGVFLGVEPGDYAHWNMRADDGSEVSFFILQPDDALAKVVDAPDSFVGRRCRAHWKTTTERIPEAGGRMKLDQITSVEWLGSSSAAPDLLWRFDTKRTDQDLPITTVRLVVEGKARKVAAGRTGEFRALEAGDYKNHGIPANALAACAGWWAGAGDAYYVTREGDALVIRHRATSEEDTAAAPWQVVLRIPAGK